MAVIRNGRKILLYLYFLLSISFVLSVLPLRWEDTSDLYDFKEEQKMPEDYDCNNLDGQCSDFDGKRKELLKIIETNDIPYKRKPSAALSSFTYDKLMQMDSSKSGTIPYFHTSSLPLPCSCGSHYRLMDLGRAYHPRYLPTAVCLPEACGALGTYHCRPRPYHVRVLRKKDAVGPENQQEANEPPLPEGLRKNWMMETVTVTVACECGP